MSQIALSPNPAGTGTFTIEAPNSNTNRTLTLPDEAGTIVTSNTAIPQAQIATALNATGSAPIYACRAWVNFNGTGTPSIRASGNVSSVSKNSTGIYTVNFTTAMPDTNYCTLVTGTNYSDTAQAYIGTEGNAGVSYASGKTTTSNRILFTNTQANVDPISANVAIFR